MADNKIEIEIVAQVDKVQKTLSAFKDSTEKNFEGLADNIGASLTGGLTEAAISASKALLPIGAALAGIKLTIDEAFKGDQIKAINAQFELLSNQAGLTADSLRSNLVGAADGLVDDTDLIQSASKAIIELGSAAAAIPETLDLARKATSLFGGEVTDNFERINQAIATGNTRGLRQIGILIDQQKALKDYANEIGVSVGSLTEAGRQQAILNAVLEKGQSVFDGVNPTINETGTSFTRLTVATKQIYDALAILAASTFGSTIAATFNSLAGLATLTADSIKSITGIEKLPISDQAEILNRKLEETNKQITQVQASIAQGFVRNDLEPLTQQAEKLRLQLSLLDEERRKSNSAERINAPVNEGPNKFDQAIDEANKAKALASVAQLNAQTIELQRTSYNEQQFALEQSRAKMAEADAQFEAARAQAIVDNGGNLANLTAQGHAQIEALEQNHQAKIAQLKESGDRVGQILAQNFQKLVGNGIAGAVQNITTSLIKGQNVFANFGKFILGLLGDFAIQVGTTIILAGQAYKSLGDFTGTAPLIAGVALVAIGTILKSLQGGGGSELAGGGGGGGGTAPGGVAFGPVNETGQLTAVNASQVGTKVEINVQGNVLDKRETGLYFAQVIQEHFDNTGTVIAGGKI